MRIIIRGNRSLSETTRDSLSRVVHPHIQIGRVERQEIPYWQQQGWSRDGNQYVGSYQTAYGAFYGTIEDRSGRNFNFLIYDPPKQIRQHSHWSCFQDRGKNWYLVHMSRKPADLSSGILTIERLLTEAFKS
jgi:hypothetical protein